MSRIKVYLCNVHMYVFNSEKPCPKCEEAKAREASK